MMFHKWDEPAQVFFLFCLPSYLMELLWISTQQGQKRSFPKPSISSAWILNCQTKVHFPLKQNEISSVEKCIHQARYKKTKQNKKQLTWALIIAHFQEDQTKYQPSQTHIYKDPHPKSQQLDEISEISAVYAAICQFRESTPWKSWENLHAGKNSFICIKSILKNNPCDQLALRWDLLVRLKVKSKPLCVWVQLAGQHFAYVPSERPKVPYSRLADND